MGMFSRKPKPGAGGAPTRSARLRPSDAVGTCKRCRGPVLRCELEMTARLGGCPGCSLRR